MKEVDFVQILCTCRHILNITSNECDNFTQILSPHEDIFTISCPWTFLSSNECDNFIQTLSTKGHFLQYHVHGHFCPQMKVTILYKHCPHEDIFTISCPWAFLSSNEGDNFIQT